LELKNFSLSLFSLQAQCNKKDKKEKGKMVITNEDADCGDKWYLETRFLSPMIGRRDSFTSI